MSDIITAKDILGTKEKIRNELDGWSPRHRALLLNNARKAYDEWMMEVSGGKADSLGVSPTWLTQIHELLNADLGQIEALLENDKYKVTEDGVIQTSKIKYAGLDYNWALCATHYKNLALHNVFVEMRHGPKEIEIPDEVTIAILGDWGGGNGNARAVGESVKKANFPYCIHLGDVYYYGDQKQYDQNFFPWWPGAAGRSFNLNSNHDMYDMGRGYYNCLDSAVFSAQGGCSYFSLWNEKYRVICLDTAFCCPDRGAIGFMLGHIHPSVENFVCEQVEKAKEQQQMVILMSHHNPISYDGKETFELWRHLQDLIGNQDLGKVLWYFGHIHIGATYIPKQMGRFTVLPRCVGHGCIPWGPARGLERSEHVEWYEKSLLDPSINYRVTNGFATLKLTKDGVEEAIRDQNGETKWANTVKHSEL